MKKTISLLIAVAILAAPATAQEKKARPLDRPANEIAVSGGYATVLDAGMLFGAAIASGISMGLAAADELKTSGSYSLEYYRYFNPHFAVGGVAQYENLYLSFKAKDTSTGEYKPGSHQTYHIIGILPAVKFPWFNREHFGMYSKAAAGVSVMITNPEGEKSTQASFAFHLSPIGMEFGGMAFRGFVECGLGWQGSLLGGVKFCF